MPITEYTNEEKKDEPINSISWNEIADDGQKPENRATQNKIFAQNDAPTSADSYHEGDIWFDTNDNNRIYRANASLQWVDVRDGTIATAATTANWSGVVDDDGNKPENNADVTSAHTAAAIASQGALATKNAVDLATAEVSNKSADNIAETAAKKWAGETGADVTSTHTADDTSKVNAKPAATIQTRAYSDFLNTIFYGYQQDTLIQTLGGNGTITRGFLNTILTCPLWAGGANSATLLMPSVIGYKKTGANLDYDNDYNFAVVAALTSNTNQDAFIGVNELPPDTDATDIHRHFGFFFQDGIIYASNADGSIQTKTDVSSGITMTNLNTYYVIYDAGTNIKFYINDVLVATHTTNMPNGASDPQFYLFIANGQNVAAKKMIINNNWFLLTPIV